MRPWHFRLLMTLVPLIILALGSFWLSEVLRREAHGTAPRPNRSEPDFYVEKFSYVKMAKTGVANYHFTGARLIHNPQDGSYDIEQPIVTNIDDAQLPITMRAERARVNSDSTQVHLFDNVRLDRPASATADAVHVKSEYMLVLPDEDVVKTDKQVEIVTGRSKLTGTGMFANNATREFRLTSNVHGTYQAPLR